MPAMTSKTVDEICATESDEAYEEGRRQRLAFEPRVFLPEQLVTLNELGASLTAANGARV
jgi:hypothetical protein